MSERALAWIKDFNARVPGVGWLDPYTAPVLEQMLQENDARARREALEEAWVKIRKLNPCGCKRVDRCTTCEAFEAIRALMEDKG